MGKGSSLKADVRRIIKDVQERGYEVVMGGSGHYKILDAEGRFMGSLSASPSDRKSILATITDLKSRGVIDQDPRKKERKKHMAETRSERTLDITPRQRELKERMLNEYVRRGWKPGARTGVQAAVAREVIQHPDTALKTFMSAEEALSSLIRDRAKLGERTMTTLEEWLLDVETRPETEKPSPASTERDMAARTALMRASRKDRPIGPTYKPILDRVAKYLFPDREPSPGRVFPYGFAPKLDDLLKTWAEEKGLGPWKKDAVHRVMDSYRNGSNMLDKTVSRVEQFLEDFDQGWRPAVAETPAPVAEEPIEKPPLDMEQYVRKIVEAEEAQPQVQVQNGAVPLHIQALAEMLRNPDMTPQFRDQHVRNAIKLSQRIYELEQLAS